MRALRDWKDDFSTLARADGGRGPAGRVGAGRGGGGGGGLVWRGGVKGVGESGWRKGVMLLLRLRVGAFGMLRAWFTFCLVNQE